MLKPLWIPSEERKRQANITSFINGLKHSYGLEVKTYPELWRWSVENISDFWASMWEFGGVKTSQDFDCVIEDLEVFPGAKWFPGARLNFAENLLRYRDDHIALVFKGENSDPVYMTYEELHDQVSCLAHSLRQFGVMSGDRVVGYMPNLMETAIAMLASTSIGATWASCATDIGSQAALDRLGQVKPKVMVTADGYVYKGKVYHTLQNAAKVAANIPSLEKVIVVSYISHKPDISFIQNAVHYEDLLSSNHPSKINFEQLPSDHPVYIMFSSGTTGKPKCMVQGAGGVLINHLKELLLHTDLTRDDKILYITSCSWMMWNWLLTSLAVGATVFLYDGNPNYPDEYAMWKLIEDEGISIFGTSATYLHYLYKQGVCPNQKYDLASLREISQTGSTLSPEGFKYVYRDIKQDLHLNSISGGTDINGCFAAGTPIQPVYISQLQGPALGMKVAAYDENGNRVYDRQGELVCEAPSPSMPLFFWDDEDGERYRLAYFGHYPDRQVWRHGDFVTFHSDTGGISFHGRSDAVLKPAGVRIGTAEIYNVIEVLDEIDDSLAIAQDWKDDQRIILFVKLAEGYELSEELKDKIKKTLFEKASPRHVPRLIFETAGIPYTFSNKKVEIAVSNILNGRKVENTDALVNPECLDYFREICSNLHA
jgi:acetoacetyl-CoA synthetase